MNFEIFDYDINVLFDANRKYLNFIIIYNKNWIFLTFAIGPPLL